MLRLYPQLRQQAGSYKICDSNQLARDIADYTLNRNTT